MGCNFEYVALRYFGKRSSSCNLAEGHHKVPHASYKRYPRNETSNDRDDAVHVQGTTGYRTQPV